MNWKYILVNLLTGAKVDEPVRLEKRQGKDKFLDRLNDLMINYIGVVAFIVIIICLILFVQVCFAVIGLSAVESGTVYNHMQGVI